MFSTNNTTHDYDTQFGKDLQISSSNLTLRSKTINARGVKIWNFSLEQFESTTAISMQVFRFSHKIISGCPKQYSYQCKMHLVQLLHTSCTVLH